MKNNIVNKDTFSLADYLRENDFEEFKDGKLTILLTKKKVPWFVHLDAKGCQDYRNESN